MDIAQATLDDLPALVELLRSLFVQESEFEPDAERQSRGLALILADPAVGRICVARDETGVVGMVSLLFTISTALGAPVCWLEDMVVAPDSRGKGVGGRLIEHAIGYARSHGFARMTLLTDGVNVDARRFYSCHGFQPSDMVAMRRLML